MSENAIENNSRPEPDTATPKGARKASKKGKPAKKASPAKKPVGKPKGDRSNKKAEVTGAHLSGASSASASDIHPPAQRTKTRPSTRPKPIKINNPKWFGVEKTRSKNTTPYRYRSPTPAKV
jgi:hypothetical protein